jgi:hypothetical protein
VEDKRRRNLLLGQRGKEKWGEDDIAGKSLPRSTGQLWPAPRENSSISIPHFFQTWMFVTRNCEVFIKVS